ncbi:hypothetical protein [Helicobacter pametensis]|uniref:hypothetical protein n=1 Tax=Helicobacter pametensis TaxID=95149 RepID=UPI0004BB0C82|nr:hypothetical protein [Helicobacter pametensis]
MTNSRRKFLKTTIKTSSFVAGGLVLAGCGSEISKSAQNKNQKKEILYNGNTPYWKEYYANAK